MPTQTTDHSGFIQVTETISDYTCFRRGCTGRWHCDRCGRTSPDWLKQTKSKPRRPFIR